jgi:tRNA (cmo5U34)-methyltransferase
VESTLASCSIWASGRARRHAGCSPFIRTPTSSASDADVAMVNAVRAFLPNDRVETRVGRLEDPLPNDHFDLIVSALALHHLPASEKALLFARIASSLRPGGVFVLGDVVVPDKADDQVTPLEPQVDLPDRLDDQLRWLAEAQFQTTVVWLERDLAVIRATMKSDQ